MAVREISLCGRAAQGTIPGTTTEPETRFHFKEC
jgi:hypothetical protein